MYLCGFFVSMEEGMLQTWAVEAECVFNVASQFQRLQSLYLNHMEIAVRHHATVKFKLHAPD